MFDGCSGPYRGPSVFTATARWSSPSSAYWFTPSYRTHQRPPTGIQPVGQKSGNAGNSDSLSPYRRRNSISGRRRGNRSAPFGSFLPFGDGRSRVRPRDAEPERGAGTRVKRQRCRTAVAERTEGNRPALRRGIRMPSSTAVTVHNLFRTDDRSRPCCEV